MSYGDGGAREEIVTTFDGYEAADDTGNGIWLR